MKTNFFILLFSALVSNGFSQSKTGTIKIQSVKAESEVYNLLRLYLTDQVDSLVSIYSPNQDAWNWLQSKWDLEDSISLQTLDSLLIMHLTEKIKDERYHDVPISDLVVDSVVPLGKTIDIFKASSKVGGIESFDIYFSANQKIYYSKIGLKKYENEFYLYPEKGFKFISSTTE